MRKALSTLLRVRSIEKRRAQNAFGEAERARIAQEELVDGIHHQIVQGRQAGVSELASHQAHWAAMEHQWRLHKEVQLRKAGAELEVRDAASQEARAELSEASKHYRVVELALEGYDERDALEQRRSDGRKLDAMATQRWWRENF